MGGDFIYKRSSSLSFSGCMSPACVPVHEEYSRVNTVKNPVERTRRSNRRLKKLLKKIVNEGKNINGSKPLKFQYDAVSYAQNFDEGCHKDDQFLWCQQVLPEFRCYK